VKLPIRLGGAREPNIHTLLDFVGAFIEDGLRCGGIDKRVFENIRDWPRVAFGDVPREGAHREACQSLRKTMNRVIGVAQGNIGQPQKAAA
jgi:hypothetical protein